MEATALEKTEGRKRQAGSWVLGLPRCPVLELQQMSILRSLCDLGQVSSLPYLDSEYSPNSLPWFPDLFLRNCPPFLTLLYLPSLRSCPSQGLCTYCSFCLEPSFQIFP